MQSASMYTTFMSMEDDALTSVLGNSTKKLPSNESEKRKPKRNLPLRKLEVAFRSALHQRPLILPNDHPDLLALLLQAASQRGGSGKPRKQRVMLLAAHQHLQQHLRQT